MKRELSKLADVLVNHSTKVQPGDQVLIQSVTEIDPIVVREIIKSVEKAGDMRMYQCAMFLLRGN